MMKKLAVALSVTLFCGSPAMAAYVDPGLGQLMNVVYVKEGAVAVPNPSFDLGADADEFLFGGLKDLSTSAAASLFSPAGGFVGADQHIDATWSGPDAGTISFDFEALIISPGDRLLGTNDGTGNRVDDSSWKYSFTAIEDGFLKFDIKAINDYLGPASDEVVFYNFGILDLSRFVGASYDLIRSTTFYNPLNDVEKAQTIVYQLTAGEHYSLQYTPTFYALGRDDPSTILFQASQQISWSIGARPVEPPDPDPGPGASVPEPATWALMMIGFGLMGGALRRRNNRTAIAGL